MGIERERDGEGERKIKGEKKRQRERERFMTKSTLVLQFIECICTLTVLSRAGIFLCIRMI